MTELTAPKVTTSAPTSKFNRIPLSTYRLQLGADRTLSQVTGLLPYLHKLGISDIYLSPLFHARDESSHGYDVVDHGAIDPAIGDLQSFSRMATAAGELGMGILLDVVPNHMGINDPGNLWWLDVLENGEGSYFADFFDIEWQPPTAALANKILLPFLGEPFGKVLENGDLRVIYRERRLQLEYGPRRLPLAPPSWPRVLELALADESLSADASPTASADRNELHSIITQLRNLPVGSRRDAISMDDRYREQKIAAFRLEQLVGASANVRTALDHALAQINGQKGEPKSFDQLEVLFDEQWYRLAYWRVASDEINYRRFFDVNDLAAIRVEDPRVFDAVHRLVARLLEAGWVTGLRIDHPDGLRDPQAYFKNLQALYRSSQSNSVDGARSIYVLAEKILCGDEPLPQSWDIAGTTGYDLLNIIGRVQVDGEGLSELRTNYDRISGLSSKPAEIVYESRRTVLLTTMASELHMLTAQLYRLAQQHRSSRDFTQPVLHQALREVLASMTVYRTYARNDSWDIDENDYRTVTSAVRMAKRRNRTMSFAALDFIASILLLEHPPTLTSDQAEARRRFALKFQQVSGPIAAKGVEDTAFYRYYPLASLNEVGGELDAKSLAVDEFHRLMQHRMGSWPHSMCATSTHDSKRGEDMRARLHVLSEASEEWVVAFARWQKLNRPLLSELDGEPVPTPNDEYFIYQTLIGTWPLTPLTDADRETYRDRILRYLEKAMREGKLHTSWMNPDETYEAAIRDFVTALFEAAQKEFSDDLSAFVAKIANAGFVNSLAQLLLKSTLPGMPDFYRGTDLWDFNLVDPDNRRPVDYDDRRHRLKNLWSAAEKDPAKFTRDLSARWADPDIKLWITTSALNLRRDLPNVFTFGEYIPLTATGAEAEHVLAFARRWENQTAICVVPRHFYRLTAGKNSNRGATGSPTADWKDTQLILPDEFANDWKCRLSNKSQHSSQHQKATDDSQSPVLDIADLFAVFPVALLTSQEN
ncbi:MAG TPA: malto-oligosyltrehalose synthase [Lacipirellulaceae bacterium]|nr:malto-oligosyltrehalose synthase [Lacipirellulaceae bacterium]